MTQFLEKLKTELADAQERQKIVAVKLNALNTEYQAVTQEVNSYMKIVEVQTRKEQGPNAAPSAKPQPTRIGIRTVAQSQPTEETNKTEMVREVLRSHPSGMTGGELWAAIQDKFQYRQYVYSILKRLKDKGDVIQKRKKFIFTGKPEEVAQQIVQ